MVTLSLFFAGVLKTTTIFCAWFGRIAANLSLHFKYFFGLVKSSLTAQMAEWYRASVS